MAIEHMTARERLIHALEGKPVDRLPFSPFLAYVWEHYPPEIQARGQLAFLQEIGADPLWRGTACPVEQSCTGMTTTRTQLTRDAARNECRTPVGTLRSVVQTSLVGNTTFLLEHPLKTEEDFKTQLWIEEHMTLAMRDQAPVAEALAQDGLALGMLLPRGKTAFQLLVEHYVGTEELVYALADFPETVEALWAAMFANHRRAVALAAQSDYTYFITWEDSSTQNYSPALYARFIAPEIRYVTDTLRAAGKAYVHHACGHLRGLLPMLRESGAIAIESLTPPPIGNISLREARAALGSELCIIGGIEPTHLLNLSMDELEPYVAQVIAEAAGGPFILANADSCPPGVGPEKFARIAGIVRDSGQIPSLV